MISAIPTISIAKPAFSTPCNNHHELVMPNGKLLSECTYGELDNFTMGELRKLAGLDFWFALMAGEDEDEADFVEDGDPQLTAALVESADDSGSFEKIAGSNILRPCSLHGGRPCSSHRAVIASPIRCHQAAVPGVRHCPDEPMATVGHSSARYSRRSIDSCICQTGTPRMFAGHCSIRASFSSSLPSMTSGISASQSQDGDATPRTMRYSRLRRAGRRFSRLRTRCCRSKTSGRTRRPRPCHHA